MVEQLGFCERVLRVGGQVVKDLVLLRSRFNVIEKAETADKICRLAVVLNLNAAVVLAEAHQQLGGYQITQVVGKPKGEEEKGVAHPRLSHDGEAPFEFPLNFAHLEGGKRTAGDSKEHLDGLHALQFEHFARVVIIVAKRVHNHVHLLFSETLGSVVTDNSHCAVVIQTLLHSFFSNFTDICVLNVLLIALFYLQTAVFLCQFVCILLKGECK